MGPILLRYTSWSFALSIYSGSNFAAVPCLPHRVLLASFVHDQFFSSPISLVILVVPAFLTVSPCTSPHSLVVPAPSAVTLRLRFFFFLFFLRTSQMMADHDHAEPPPAYPYMQITSRVRLVPTSCSIWWPRTCADAPVWRWCSSRPPP